jgi:hypothetical protein
MLARHDRISSSEMICPRCRCADCLRSRRGGVADFFATLIQLRPWRCQACDLRFYAWTVALPFVHYVHCPRCGNFDLEHIASERVEQGTLVFLKRFLGFPAYRCDPCRQKFFSMLPYRRIVPSMFSPASRKFSG